MRKRYIIKCFGCGCLEEVSRSDAVCCSSQCRVRLHRHPELHPFHPDHFSDEVYRGILANLLDGLTPSFFAQTEAYAALFPDRMDAVIGGDINLSHPTRKDVIADKHRDDAREAFWKLIRQQLAKEET